MLQAEILQHTSTILMLVLLISLPALAVSAIVGFVVGLFQAVTQIQDQTLPQAFKLVAILATLLIAGRWMAAPLIEQARLVFDAFPALTR